MTAASAPIHILLATCNGERFLPALLDSLIAQTDPDWVVLARDDASDDGTVAILRDFAARDGRVRLVEDDAGRLGIRANFETLMRHALAMDVALFALCDQDDVWRPEKLARMRAALDAAAARHGTRTPLLAYADLAWIDAAGHTIATSHFERAGAAQVRRGVGPWLLAHNLVPGCAMVGNRALLARALPLPPQVTHHDWWLVLVAAAAGHVIAVDAVLTEYRQHGGNAIGASSPARRVAGFALAFRARMRQARSQYHGAVAQAAALVDRLGSGGGHSQWLAHARSVRDALGSSSCRVRACAAARGPVRRIGAARNALMLIVAVLDLPGGGPRPEPGGTAPRPSGE